MQHPALQFRHFGDRQTLGLGKSIQIAEQITQGIPQAAILVGLVLQDFLANAQILE